MKTFIFNKTYLHSMKIYLHLIIFNFHSFLFFLQKKKKIYIYIYACVQWHFLIQWFSVVKSGLSFISEKPKTVGWSVSWLQRVCSHKFTQTSFYIWQFRCSLLKFIVRFVKTNLGLHSFSTVKAFALAYITTLNWGNLYFSLTAYVGTDPVRNNNTSASCSTIPQQEKRKAQIQHFLVVPNSFVENIELSVFIKLKKHRYLYSFLFSCVEAFNVQPQADFSQFSSSSC